MPYEIVKLRNSIAAEPLPPETWPDTIGRNIKNVGASALGGFAEVPRSAVGLIKGGRERAMQNLAPIEEAPERVKKFIAQKQPEFLTNGITSGIESLEQALPTAEGTRQTVAPYLSDESLEPRNQGEQLLQDFATDFGALLFPVPGGAASRATTLGEKAIKGAKTLGKAAAVSGVGNLSEWATKKIPGGDKYAPAVKAGTMIATSFGLQPSLKKRAGEMYQELKINTPENLAIPKKPVEKIIKDLRGNWLDIGDKTTHDKDVIRKIVDSLENNIEGDRIKIKNLIQFKQDQSGRWEDIRKLSPTGRKYFDELYAGLNKSLKNNPLVPKAISGPLTSADELFTGINETEKAMEWIRDTPAIDKVIKGGLLGIALRPIESAKTIGKAALGAVALPVAPVFMGIKHAITKPAIRNEYIKAIGAAINKSVPATIKHLRKFEKELEKDMNKKSDSGYEIVKLR